MRRFGWRYYFKPTPKRIKVLGDSLAAGSLFVAGLSLISGYEKIAIGVAISGWAGKVISNFFTDEKISG